MPAGNPLLIKITRESLPQVKDKYPFIYLEHGRLEIDDSSIKWIDAEGNVVRLPAAVLNTILLGPGTSVTHAAVKTAAAANCSICWVGEDSLLFYAAGITPTSNSRNFKRQMMLAADPEKALKTARKMFAHRFPDAELAGKNLNELMGMEGRRVRTLYLQKAEEYGVGWKGRRYIPGKMQLSDTINQILTSVNAALYGILCSVVHALGYSPHIGFIHSGSPLPFIYDLADLYKDTLCIDLAFFLTKEMAGTYNKHMVADTFRKRVVEMDLLVRATDNVLDILGGKK